MFNLLYIEKWKVYLQKSSYLSNERLSSAYFICGSYLPLLSDTENFITMYDWYILKCELRSRIKYVVELQIANYILETYSQLCNVRVV